MGLEVFDLGLIDFRSACEFQREIFREVRDRRLELALIVCRHYPVITLGRQAKRKNILVSEEELRIRGIELDEIERGGDVTYHGPGQLTVYPVVNLIYFKKDIHLFLRQLEEVAISLLSDFGILGVRYPCLTGVWVEKEKIASIGIAVKNWISFHGLSINLKEEDLDNFRFIRPCGMDIKMTALESVLGRNIEVNDVKDRFISGFRNIIRENRDERSSLA